jgi:hypothetical protein
VRRSSARIAREEVALPKHGSWLWVGAALALWPGGLGAAPVTGEWIARWRADLAFAADSVPRAHPNFFHSVSREAYRAALDSLSARVPTLEPHEVVVELARIVALVHDGHTRLTFPFDSAAGFFTGHARTASPHVPGLVFRHYPIRFGLFADTLYVIQADSAHRELLGGRVVSLGTMPAAAAMAAVEPTIQRDNDSQVRDLMATWLVCPEILHARGVIADRERLPLVVEHAGGARTRSTLAPAKPGIEVHWLDARPAGPPPLRDRHPERRHWFTTVPGTRTIYARYREVMDDPDESVARFADSLFATIETRRADRLVLDLRGNVGGNGFLNRPLVQHLIRAERLWRPGGSWALIDRGTFSAAVMMAADLETRTPTILVGEKTGGHPNSYGDSRRIELPNSGVTVRVSSLYWQLTGPQDDRDGITPHVEVEPTFDEWRLRRDPALEAAVARGGSAADLAGSWNGSVGWQASRLTLRVDLTRRGATWEGRVSLPEAGIETAPLTGVRVADGALAAAWTSDGESWSLAARPAGDRLVGILHVVGQDFAFVLRRTGARADTR